MALSSGRSAIVAVRSTPGFSRLGEQDGDAEDEPDGDDGADEARRRPAVDPGLVHDRVPLAACDEPAVDGTAATKATASAKLSEPQNSHVPSPASIAPGTATTTGCRRAP